MAEKKVEKKEEVIIKNLNESIISIRVKLQNAKLKKSGKNKFAGFDYFELADFLPKLNELMLEEKVNDRFFIKDDYAFLELQKDEEVNIYQIPFVLFDTPLTFKKDRNGNFMKNKENEYIQVPSMQDIQYLGALNTYYKRYLYLNAFGITDGEVIDSMNNDDLNKTTTTQKLEINYRQMLINYCSTNGLDMTEIAKEHKLNAKSKQEDFKVVLESLGVK